MADDPRFLFGGLLACAAVKYAGFTWIRYKTGKSYVKVGRVAELYVYPIKSFRGLKVEEAECTRVGLKARGVSDRSWTVATKDGVYLTQRQEPTMALIQTSVHGDQITLEAPGMPPLSLPSHPDVRSTPHSKVTVKVDTVETLDCGEEAAGWLCKYFKRDGLRLHFSHPELEKRDSFNAKKAWAHPAKPGDLVNGAVRLLCLHGADLGLSTRPQQPSGAARAHPQLPWQHRGGGMPALRRGHVEGDPHRPGVSEDAGRLHALHPDHRGPVQGRQAPHRGAPGHAQEVSTAGALRPEARLRRERCPGLPWRHQGGRPRLRHPEVDLQSPGSHGDRGCHSGTARCSPVAEVCDEVSSARPQTREKI